MVEMINASIVFPRSRKWRVVLDCTWAAKVKDGVLEDFIRLDTNPGNS